MDHHFYNKKVGKLFEMKLCGRKIVDGPNFISNEVMTMMKMKDRQCEYFFENEQLILFNSTSIEMTFCDVERELWV